MNKKLSLKTIVQADNRGTLLLTEKTAEGKGQPAVTVAISFTDPKEAAKFEQGEEYTVTVIKVKK